MSNGTRLRASCERCRGQKLRCLPTGDSESGAPCQRCVKAKVADSCVFNSRLRAQRPAGGRASSTNVVRNKDKDFDMDAAEPAFPGMGTFTLSSPFSSKSRLEASDSDRSSSTQDDVGRFSMEYCRSGSISSSSSVHTSWDDDCLDAFLQQQQVWNDSMYTDGLKSPCPRQFSITSCDSGYQIDACSPTQLHDVFQPPLRTCSMENVTHQDMSHQQQSSEPLMDLTGLLADMSPYERRLSKLLADDPADYPVGDALFFSHLFHKILSTNSILATCSSTSAVDMPTMLLIISCFMTLTRIYSFVFQHLHQQILRDFDPRAVVYNPSDFHSYRGLRLSQLQQVCRTPELSPIEKTTTMLLGLLSSIEELLGFPSEVRVTPSSRANSPTYQRPNVESNDHGPKRALFAEHDSLAVLQSGGLYQTVGLQARELQQRVAEVNELLQNAVTTADL